MPDNDKSIKLGIIGCGHVTEKWHLPALHNLSSVEVVAVADINSDCLERVTDRFRIKKRYSNFMALLEDPAIDAVAVCVPAQFHVKVALAAIDAKKHLLIEKPLALSLDECDQLINRAKQSSCITMVGFNMRWHRLIRQAQEIIQKGTLGPIKMIRSIFTCSTQYPENIMNWRKKREYGGGTLIEVAVHHFDLWRFLLQSEVEEIFVMSRSDQSDDEVSSVTARMTNDVIAVSSFSEEVSANNEVEILGEAGRLQVSCYRFDGLEFSSTSRFPGDIQTRFQSIANTVKELPQVIFGKYKSGDWASAFQFEWGHFIKCIQENTPAECTLEDGRLALQIVLAALKSASLGQPVKIAQAPRTIMPMVSDITTECDSK